MILLLYIITKALSLCPKMLIYKYKNSFKNVFFIVQNTVL